MPRNSWSSEALTSASMICLPVIDRQSLVRPEPTFRARSSAEGDFSTFPHRTPRGLGHRTGRRPQAAEASHTAHARVVPPSTHCRRNRPRGQFPCPRSYRPHSHAMSSAHVKSRLTNTLICALQRLFAVNKLADARNRAKLQQLKGAIKYVGKPEFCTFILLLPGVRLVRY